MTCLGDKDKHIHSPTHTYTLKERALQLKSSSKELRETEKQCPSVTGDLVKLLQAIKSNISFLEERMQNLKHNFESLLNVPSTLSSEIKVSEQF